MNLSTFFQRLLALKQTNQNKHEIDWKNLVQNNRSLKGVGHGKRAFLFATGPSLKQENLRLLKNENCFSVSNFFLHNDIKKINPKIHFFAPYHKPVTLDSYVEWLKLADNTLPHTTKICLGHTTHDIVKKFNLFPKREVFYLYLGPSCCDENKINLRKSIMTPQTGPLMILPVLIYMGYNEIYLLGCDHTVLRDYGKPVTNFYPAEKDIRKFETKSDDWESILETLECYKRVFTQYRFYKKIADKNNIKIINLSQDSWLQEFPQKQLVDIL